MSLVASPNIFEPEENITEADSYCTFKNPIEAVPFTVTFPVMVPPAKGRYKGATDAVKALEEETANNELEAFIANDELIA